MSRKVMGFEGLIYYGAAGSSASTLIEDRVDATISIDSEKAETTVVGDGTAIPIKTEEITTRSWSMTLTMKRSADGAGAAAVSALLAAATSLTPSSATIALRTADLTGGKGFNGDVLVDAQDGMPLKGEQTLDFTFTPTGRLRAPQTYV